MAQRDCSCGFWAYYNLGRRPNPYASGREFPHVEAIIEGYGLVTIGTKGFRCSKAHLVALVAPLGVDTGHRRWSRYELWLTAILLWGTFFLIADLITGRTLGIIINAALLGMNTMLLRWHLKRLANDRRASAKTRERWPLVRQLYPDVPVYPSMAKAIAAHPLSKPPEDRP